MVDRNEETDELEELDLDDDGDDVETVIREAEAAVEEVESSHGKGAARRRLAERDEELERLRREVLELRDKSLRTLAEFENFRKRTDREQQDLRRYAVTEPMRAFLDVVDNLERALAASGSLDDLKTGVGMILRQMQDLLRQHGVREVTAAGEAFDHVGKVIGIDLGTTNSCVAVVETVARRRCCPTARGAGPPRRSSPSPRTATGWSARSPSGRRSPTPRTPSSRSSG
jgi:molecular chaperone GrpE